ncbi:MAG: prolipoprotein diacylglyceryl transferase [Erysipelotrichaceae bacterium]|nr:prolipoprotein diacylglyceryl transferase [Erysipelotrichaceae bacterium]
MNILALPTSISIGPLNITFYACCILLGALLSLVLSMWKMKRIGYDPKELENLFLVAFPLGLVGARLWYCIWQAHEFVRENIWLSLLACIGVEKVGDSFQFQGLSGLAIQGGVILGVLSGVMFVKKYRKNMKLVDIADTAVPTILVAQAVGRWGNFFNQEVYGKPVPASNWSWLGQWFIDQMTIPGSGIGPGEIANPLFLIEGMINSLGFILLFIVMGILLKKYIVPGVITFSYFIWYGIVRFIMEPLRNQDFIMTPNGEFSTSQFTALLFIIVGVLGVVLLYVNHYVLKPKKKDMITLVNSYSSWFDNLSHKTKVILLVVPVTGWINASLYRFSKGNFNAGIISLILGPIFWIMDLVYYLTKGTLGVWSTEETIKDKTIISESINEGESKDE